MRSNASESCASTFANSCSSARNMSLKLLISMAAALSFHRRCIVWKWNRESGGQAAFSIPVLRILNEFQEPSVPPRFQYDCALGEPMADTSLHQCEQEVEQARTKLASDLAALRSPSTYA